MRVWQRGVVLSLISLASASSVFGGQPQPTISKSFLLDAIEVNGTVLVQFLIQNPGGSTLTGLAFTDALTGGLSVASPNQLSSDCGGTVTADPGTASISLAGGSVAGGSSCTILVAITAATVGTQTNTTGPLSSTEGGTGPASNQASIAVLARGSLQKAFGAPSVSPGSSTTLTFTVSNLNAAATYDNVAWNDILPGGLVIATPNALAGTCLSVGGGVTSAATVTAPAGGGTIDVFGLGLGALGSCTVSLSVTGTTPGTKNNQTSPVTYSFLFGNDKPTGGSGPPASANLDVVGAVLAITKTHLGTFTQGDTGRQYKITVANNGNGATSGTLTVTDTLPAGLTATALSGTGWTCADPLPAPGPAVLTCTSADAIAGGGSYPPITLTVSVDLTAPPTVTNVVQASGGGSSGAPVVASDPTAIGAIPIAQVPTLGGMGLAALAVLLALAGWVTARRRSPRAL